MKQLFKSKIFLKQFISFFILICTTLAAISIVIIAFTRQAQQEQLVTITETYRIEASETLHRWVAGREYNIRTQAMFMEKFNLDKLASKEMTELIREQLKWNKNFHDITIMNAKGDIINSKDGAVELNISDREYFVNAMKGQSTIQGFFKSRKDGKPVMAISEPIRAEGEIKYVLSGVISLERIREIVESINFGELGDVYLVDSEGMFITSTEYIEEFMENDYIQNKDKYAINTEAVKKVIEKTHGSGIYKDFMDNKVYGSYEWMNLLGLGLIVELKDSTVMKPMYDLMKLIILLGCAVVTSAGMLAFFISRRMIYPINSLINSAKAITDQNYKELIKIKTGDELDTLVEHFNSMQSAIRLREEQLNRKNEQLKAQRAEAVQANVLKSQFLANMSHELRTPLNSIIGFTNRVLRKSGDILPTMQKENLYIVRDEAEHLLSLINDLLDYSKIEAGKMDVHPEAFNLVKVVEEVNNIMTNLAEGKNLNYKKPLTPDTSMPIISDKMKVKQILINLVSNAVKYSEKGTITLDISLKEGCYVIKVKDEGIGIAKEDLKCIFDEFRQVDGSYTRKVGGTGLGLSITKRFIEMLGGNIEVESTLGKGSVFTLSLPLEYGRQGSSEVEQEVSLVHDTSDKKKVVCIDDDVNVQKLYKQYLDEQGIETIVINSSDNVVSDIAEINPEVVLLDIMLPYKDGWDILAELKNNKETAAIPIIIVSVLSEQKLAYRMLADDYLIKPVSQEELIQTIARTVLKKEGIEILVADDDENYLNLIGQFLREEALSFRLACNGEEALKKINAKKPDLLILDIMMPGKDGFEILEEINKVEAWKDISVIVVTAKDLSHTEKVYLKNRTKSLIQKSGIHLDNVMEILLSLVKEKTKHDKNSHS